MEWDENPRKFIANALKPAKVSNVIIISSDEKTAAVVVPNDQLSLAIGKRGVNVRLTVKLTGWKLDIYSEDEYEKRRALIQDETSSSFADRILQTSQEVDAESQQKEETAADTTATDDEAATTETTNEDIKVSDLAKECGLKTADLMEKAKEFGIEIKSNRSKLTPDTAEKLRESLAEG